MGVSECCTDSFSEIEDRSDSDNFEVLEVAPGLGGAYKCKTCGVRWQMLQASASSPTQWNEVIED